jgi:hypothetical protein
MRGDPLASRRIAATQAILPLLMTVLKPLEEQDLLMGYSSHLPLDLS